ncbi:hypothetical protein Tco_0114186 [Tanacetum coccineum]
MVDIPIDVNLAEMEFNKTLPPGNVSSDSVSSDSESEHEKVNVAPETTIGTLTQEPYATHTFPRSLFAMGESFLLVTHLMIVGLAP